VAKGVDALTAFSLEAFQRTVHTSYNTDAHTISLEPAMSAEVIPHHGELVPHWEHYMKKVVERARATTFVIHTFQLRQSSLDVIVPSVMQLERLAELGLCKCSIDRDGLLFLSKFLAKNISLKRLLLNDNRIDDIEVAHALSLALKHHPRMEELCVSRCGVGSDGRILPVLLDGCARLEVLRLNENGIETGARIGAFLAGNPSLDTLRLDGNSLSDADASGFALALKTNTNLQYLYLKGNDFTDAGVDEITAGVLDATSLNSIATSNHECEVSFGSSVGTSNINEKPCSTKRKVQSKILIALYGVCSGRVVWRGHMSPVQYFRDVPLELISHGLELIQQKSVTASYSCDESRAQLSRMFCFIRSWNVPWMFEGASRRNASAQSKTLH